MPYTHSKLPDLRAALSQRLGDTAAIHWITDELTTLITDALRMFGLASGYWRDRGVLPLTAGVAFYDLNTAPTLASLVGYTVTDADTLGALQYMLIEARSATGVGAKQFAFADLVAALQRARNQLIDDTFVTVSELAPIVVVAGSGGVVDLPDNVTAIRRAVWRTPSGRVSNIHTSDEAEAHSYNTLYALSPGTPELYSVLASPPLKVRLIPEPIDTGTLELIVVETGADLSPSTPTLLGIPDDTAWVARDLALADLLGRDGPAYDPERSIAARRRYELGVRLIIAMSQVLTVDVNGQPLIPSSLAEIDFAYAAPHWQSAGNARPTDVGIVGGNLLAVRPPPNGTYSATLDLTTRAAIPADDITDVQLGREQLDAVLDGAESLALVKLGATHIGESDRLLVSMLSGARRYNSKLDVDGYGDTMRRTSTRDEAARPERSTPAYAEAGATASGGAHR